MRTLTEKQALALDEMEDLFPGVYRVIGWIDRLGPIVSDGRHEMVIPPDGCGIDLPRRVLT